MIFAEGLAAESYLDTGNRAMFANGGAGLELYPDMSRDNSQARRVAESRVAFVTGAARVEPVWRSLAARAASLGLLPPMIRTADPGLTIEADGIRFSPVSVVDGVYTFVLARRRGGARLVSRDVSTVSDRPWLDDPRRLGVAVRRISIRVGAVPIEIALDDPRLGEGWWQVERDGGAAWRWTNGSATLPLDAGPAVVEIKIGALPDHYVALTTAA